MIDGYTCSSSFEIPKDSIIYAILTLLADINSAIYQIIVIFIGPINVVMNIFVMFILTRKEVRNAYNFVFFLMALNQTIVIGSLTLSMFKIALFAKCNTSFFSLHWAIFDLVVQLLIPICKAHATWLAVIVAFIRLKCVRSQGYSEFQLSSVCMLCGGMMIFVIVTSIPTFLSFTIQWDHLGDICKPDELVYVDMLVPRTRESMAVYNNDCLVRKGRELLAVNVKESPDDERATTLLILIMLTTMVSEIPQAILGLLEGILSDQIRTQLTSKISTLVISLMLLTSAGNLFIYLYMSKKFRMVAKKYLCATCRRFRKIAVSRQPAST